MTCATQNDGYGGGYDSYGYGYGYGGRRRTKTDWLGVSMGESFKQNVDYWVRLAARRLFYAAARRIQRRAAEHAGDLAGEGAFEAKARPQLSPFHTTYPPALAGPAAVGHTGFLEYRARVQARSLAHSLSGYLQNPAAVDEVAADPVAYKKLAGIVVDIVHTRLLLEDLRRLDGMAFLEYYRLFLASQHRLRYRSVPRIVRAVVLAGDVLPEDDGRERHPLTAAVLEAVRRSSFPYLRRLPETQASRLLALGQEWARVLCRCLAPFLPEAGEKPATQRLPPGLREALRQQAQHRFGPQQRTPPPAPDEIPPLEGPRPPSLFDSENTAQDLAEALKQAAADPEEGRLRSQKAAAPGSEAEAAIRDFASAVEGASGQASQWEDMRSDLVEDAVRAKGFQEGPLQGNPTDGHSVTIPLANGESQSGEIFDRPVDLSDDDAAYDKLLAEARPVTDALRRTLYPNIAPKPETQRFRTGGSLDPSRLVLADVSAAVFRRFRIRERLDRRGRPVLLIACDGSGSLNAQQMRMTKVLAAAWMQSTARSQIQVVAGLYHSGTIRGSSCGPLVQWMYHPYKTAATGRLEAARALVSLPESGTGIQSDALSIGFMVEEAMAVARGSSVYLILISDCAWNRSFRSSLDGEGEVKACLESLQQAHADKLHTTLVAVGLARPETGFEKLVDQVIVVAPEDLEDPANVATRVGEYVATCMRKRRKVA